jgi:3-oxoacyl-[acyl-carrier protein] reductase
MQLAGKTAVVTGGGAGIGSDIVRQLAVEGARVISVDWNEEDNCQVAASVRATGGQCEARTADVSSSTDVKRIFEGIGPVDILVNNAAFSKGDGFLLDISEQIWDQMLAICLKSAFLCTQAALSSMVERRAGAIVNISSVNALSGIHLAAYSAAKGGVLSLTKVLTAQYGRYGIRINAICPGTILSQSSRIYYEANPEVTTELKALYPAEKFGSTSDIASAVLFLVSEQASFINGAVLAVDGGLSAVHQLPSLRKPTQS